jgi:hypothetical protein
MGNRRWSQLCRAKSAGRAVALAVALFFPAIGRARSNPAPEAFALTERSPTQPALLLPERRCGPRTVSRPQPTPPAVLCKYPQKARISVREWSVQHDV